MSKPSGDWPPVVSVLPQDPPMVLLDGIETWQPESRLIVCTATVAADSGFVHNGSARGVVALEYMAQTAAAYVGMCARKAGKAARIGYLIGVRQMELHADGFVAGQRLRIEARHAWGDEALGLFEARVLQVTEPIATGTLTVYQSPSAPRTEGT